MNYIKSIVVRLKLRLTELIHNISHNILEYHHFLYSQTPNKNPLGYL
jgi:uncharacterized membrane protein